MGNKALDLMVNNLLQADVLNELTKSNDPNEISKVVKNKANEISGALPDTKVYRTVVLMLGIIGIIAIGGSVLLEGIGKSIPDVIIALGSAAVGGLAAALTIQKE